MLCHKHTLSCARCALTGGVVAGVAGVAEAALAAGEGAGAVAGAAAGGAHSAACSSCSTVGATCGCRCRATRTSQPSVSRRSVAHVCCQLPVRADTISAHA